MFPLQYIDLQKPKIINNISVVKKVCQTSSLLSMSMWWSKNYQRIQGREDERSCTGGHTYVAETVELFVQRHHCRTFLRL